VHPIHMQFVANCEHLWERVVVYDVMAVVPSSNHPRETAGNPARLVAACIQRLDGGRRPRCLARSH
jgi:hypothetical protein